MLLRRYSSLFLDHHSAPLSMEFNPSFEDSPRRNMDLLFLLIGLRLIIVE
jgi:hypothetical protein